LRKNCHTRVRSRGHVVLTNYTRMVRYYSFVQPLDERRREVKWQGWTNVRSISLRSALQRVADGQAIAITRSVPDYLSGVAGAMQVEVVGYRALQPVRSEGPPPPTTLTEETMQAVSNAVGGAALQDYERRELEKFQVWAFIGDTKAVAVRPRTSEADRRVAMGLLSVRKS
jgi:hypothetical protein